MPPYYEFGKGKALFTPQTPQGGLIAHKEKASCVEGNRTLTGNSYERQTDRGAIMGETPIPPKGGRTPPEPPSMKFCLLSHLREIRKRTPRTPKKAAERSVTV